MANFIPAKAKNDFNQQFVYDFKDSRVKPNSTDSYFSTSLPDPYVTSLIYSNKTNTTYTTSKMYIYRLLHSNISDVTEDNSTIVGELVVELTPTTGSTKAYMCFLLESTPTGISQTNTPIDDLLDPNNADKEITVNVGSFMSSLDSCIVYTESKNSNTVFIFTQPIFITSTSYDTITKSGTNNTGYDSTTDLFNVGAPTEYSKIPNTNIKSSKKNEVLIDCTPTTVTDSFQTWTSSMNEVNSDKIVEGLDSKIMMVPSTSDKATNEQWADMQKMTIFGMVKFLADRLKIVIFRPILDEIHYFFLQNIRN
jgi:hypothetical protein